MRLRHRIFSTWPWKSGDIRDSDVEGGLKRARKLSDSSRDEITQSSEDFARISRMKSSIESTEAQFSEASKAKRNKKKKQEDQTTDLEKSTSLSDLTSDSTEETHCNVDSESDEELYSDSDSRLNAGRTSSDTNYNEHSDTFKEVSTAEEKSLSIVVVGNDASRGHWNGIWDFLMSMISYSVGLANVWRFPYLCYRNGGGAFWLAYMVFLLLSAIPVFLMEVIVGQYLQKGAMEMWKLAPLFSGVGYGNIVISAMCVWYFCVIISWAAFYMIQSVRSEFPWETCEHEWNTNWCTSGNDTEKVISLMNSTGYNETEVRARLQTAVEQYWERRVLQQTDSFLEIGGIQWEIFGINVVAWLVIYFAMWNGITHARKFIYFCAIFPYFVIAILIGRSITLEGSLTGLAYYLLPDLKSLWSINLWKDAGTQVFYSYGVGFGTLIALGSHNKFNHNCYRDTLMLCFINLMTSFLAGLAIFGMLGHMAFKTGKEIGEVVKPGLGLTFIVYPETATFIPGKQFWALLFFVMIIILGFDSQVCMVEGVYTGLADRFPILQRYRKMSLLAFCVFYFVISIPMMTYAGVHWVNVVDCYGAAGYALLFVVFFEIMGIAWAFGADRVYACMYEMTDKYICKGWVWLWKFTSPTVAAVLFFVCLAFYQPLKYDSGKSYELIPQIFGFAISGCSMICIPVYAIYYMFFKKIRLNRKERLRRGVRIPKEFVPVHTPPYADDMSSSDTKQVPIHEYNRQKRLKRRSESSTDTNKKIASEPSSSSDTLAGQNEADIVGKRNDGRQDDKNDKLKAKDNAKEGDKKDDKNGDTKDDKEQKQKEKPKDEKKPEVDPDLVEVKENTVSDQDRQGVINIRSDRKITPEEKPEDSESKNKAPKPSTKSSNTSKSKEKRKSDNSEST
ncbi:unnamed protein product [Bursaphelenchus okinawaensis]|uniref:Transporter n=1 Tax=Bursaphelenchus okinawaensis TaxID=465554 RepID=A0A811K0X6_9BILA|nr:unnamed protein product [Bursaphelenchus okinawaensis]CAG9088573.1 unnamed protein product [Bursaphelenchus okinawaensis]